MDARLNDPLDAGIWAGGSVEEDGHDKRPATMVMVARATSLLIASSRAIPERRSLSTSDDYLLGTL